MIDMLDPKLPLDNAMLAILLLAQAGLPVSSCECGHCPVGIESFQIDVHRILIRADGKDYELVTSKRSTMGY